MHLIARARDTLKYLERIEGVLDIDMCARSANLSWSRCRGKKRPVMVGREPSMDDGVDAATSVERGVA